MVLRKLCESLLIGFIYSLGRYLQPTLSLIALRKARDWYHSGTFLPQVSCLLSSLPPSTFTTHIHNATNLFYSFFVLSHSSLQFRYLPIYLYYILLCSKQNYMIFKTLQFYVISGLVGQTEENQKRDRRQPEKASPPLRSGIWLWYAWASLIVDLFYSRWLPCNSLHARPELSGSAMDASSLLSTRYSATCDYMLNDYRNQYASSTQVWQDIILSY